MINFLQQKTNYRILIAGQLMIYFLFSGWSNIFYHFDFTRSEHLIIISPFLQCYPVIGTTRVNISAYEWIVLPETNLANISAIVFRWNRVCITAATWTLIFIIQAASPYLLYSHYTLAETNYQYSIINLPQILYNLTQKSILPLYPNISPPKRFKLILAIFTTHTIAVQNISGVFGSPLSLCIR